MADDLKKALHDAGLDRVDFGSFLDDGPPIDGTCTGACEACEGTCKSCQNGNYKA